MDYCNYGGFNGVHLADDRIIMNLTIARHLTILIFCESSSGMLTI